MSLVALPPAPLPPFADGHAPWCAGGCPRWLATGAPTCLPDACVCAQTRKDAGERYPWTLPDPRCWWKTKAGSIRSRCPCWGAVRDGKPGDCCAHHSANPRYVWEGVVIEVTDDGEVLPVLPAADDDGTGRPADADAIVWDDDEQPYGSDPARERKPFVRRWAPADLTCTCLTPWDARKTPGGGNHCPDCHLDFASVMAAGMHRPRWTDECRDPYDVTDVDTGAMLLVERDGVWAIDWAANCR